MRQTWIYSETASMFPDKPGGISLYAHEGWRGRFLRDRPGQDRGQRRGLGDPGSAHRQPVPVDDLLNGRRLAGAVRDRARRHDDQAVYHLNRYHVPTRAMTVDLVVNVLLVLLISSNLAILYMSNIGYVLAHFLALSGFLLLRRDRPNWPRPIRVGPVWLWVAGI